MIIETINHNLIHLLKHFEIIKITVYFVTLFQ